MRSILLDKVCSPEAPNIAKVREILATFPSVRQLVNAGDLKAALDRAHPSAHALFQWVVNSNRTFLVRLPSANTIAGLACKHQFLMK
eukprot:SAG22_NODE_9147_length_607_cov_1.435039_1_plen_86_part_10